MTRTILSVILCGFLFAGFIGWRVHVLANRTTPQFEMVFDPSFSHPEGCESLAGLAEKSFHTDGISKDSSLVLLILGDASTANEPWQLARYSFPVTNKVIEGNAANTRRKAELVSEIQRKCELIHRTSISPIFLGVKQAVADLRARGCKAGSRCRLSVDSDLEENTEQSIKDALNRTHQTKAALPTRLDNEGVEVSFCGLAVTAGRIVNPAGRELLKNSLRGPGRDDRLRQVWRSLFTEPELVTFEPYCPKPSDLAAVAPSKASGKK